MINEFLFLLETAFVFCLVLTCKKFFGKYGLMCWVVMAAITANIEVLKCLNMFGISATGGNVMFASVFFASNILTECYGKEYAQKAIYISFFLLFVYVINMQLTLAYIPNDIDFSTTAMETIFYIMPRVCLASISMFALANFFNIAIYDRLKNSTSNKLWLRNNIATILCNCLENFGFAFLAFYGVYDISDLISIAATTSIIEIFLSIADTPFLYIAKHKT